MGALLLFIRFLFQMPVGQDLWWGVFHSISAFCNAGFDIMGAVEQGGSLVLYVGDPAVNLVQKKNMAVLENFSLAASMLIAMAAAVVMGMML